MDKTRRVTFSFDEREAAQLRKMREEGFVPRIIHHTCFPKPEPTGSEEVVVRNPETGEERILIVPTFK